MTIPASETRVCKACGAEKPIEGFARAGQSWRRGVCKACRVEKVTQEHMLRRYGITQDGKDQMLADQGGACLICASSEPRHAWGWATDHDHKTNTLRGILCQPCNLALGALEALNNAGILWVALRYAGIETEFGRLGVNAGWLEASATTEGGLNGA